MASRSRQSRGRSGSRSPRGVGRVTPPLRGRARAQPAKRGARTGVSPRGQAGHRGEPGACGRDGGGIGYGLGLGFWRPRTLVRSVPPCPSPAYTIFLDTTQVVRFGCRGGCRFPYLRPVILATSASLADIPVRAGNASRGIWRMSSLMGWPTVLSSRIWCSWVTTRPKESRLFDVANREIPVENCMCKATRGVRPR